MKNLGDNVLLACSEKCYERIRMKRGKMRYEMHFVFSLAVEKFSAHEKAKRDKEELENLIVEETRRLLGPTKKPNYFHANFHARPSRAKMVLEIRHKNRNGKSKRKRG